MGVGSPGAEARLWRTVMTQTVENILGRSDGARATARLGLGSGCGVVIWENHHGRVRYERPGNHTFSLYLNDGTGTRRLDAGGVAGWPGAVCVMPAGHRSDWEITTPFRFVHLYLSDTRLRGSFSAIHDCDARRLMLADETFTDMPRVAEPLAALARAAVADDTLQADAAVTTLIGRLPGRPVRISGGLAPHILRRVEEYIEAHLSEPISLDDLSGLADMSGFHFHRMFRRVRGCPPHDWVTRRRVERARMHLRAGMPIAEVAAACGFSSQSHLTRVVRARRGVTPGQVRRACRPD